LYSKTKSSKSAMVAKFLAKHREYWTGRGGPALNIRRDAIRNLMTKKRKINSNRGKQGLRRARGEHQYD